MSREYPCICIHRVKYWKELLLLLLKKVKNYIQNRNRDVTIHQRVDC